MGGREGYGEDEEFGGLGGRGVYGEEGEDDLTGLGPDGQPLGGYGYDGEGEEGLEGIGIGEEGEFEGGMEGEGGIEGEGEMEGEGEGGIGAAAGLKPGEGVHPPGTVSFLCWKIYCTWLEGFAKNIQTYAMCLRNFRQVFEGKHMFFFQKVSTMIYILELRKK